MFIAKYPNGKTITEKDMFWDDVPAGMRSLELTIPIAVSYIDPETKEEKQAPKRTVSINGFERYYFYNEAVANISTEGNGSKGRLEAKAIGGIDSEGNVVEVRIDFRGFVSVRHFKIEQLAQTGIKQGAK